MKIKIFLSFITFLLTQLISGQTTDTTVSYILSGVVVNGETNELLVGAHLLSANQFGTKTDETGTFSITVLPNDTLTISYIGYKNLTYVSPQQNSGKYLIKFKLYTDSITLQEVEIFPWPTYDEFKKAFAELKEHEPEIKMEGVKMYQDRNINPMEFTMLHILTNPISLIYDKLLDKKAKQRRRIERRRETIKDASFIDD
ncbi:MAG: carboxypeptidase-like regulatory domain-containing protein [Flavobacteriales bacterium]|nr:carboxypeptidase-like regulatory domain-containing protein [Flavobacteriales bacterium]